MLKKGLELAPQKQPDQGNLLRWLAGLNYQHHLREWMERRGWEVEEQVPRVVCSMGLV